MQEAIVMFLFVCTALLTSLCFLYLAVFIVKAIVLNVVQSVREIQVEKRKMEQADKPNVNEVYIHDRNFRD